MGGVCCCVHAKGRDQFTTVIQACTMVERSFSRSNYGTISGQARGFTVKGEDYHESIGNIFEIAKLIIFSV